MQNYNFDFKIAFVNSQHASKKDYFVPNPVVNSGLKEF